MADPNAPDPEKIKALKETVERDRLGALRSLNYLLGKRYGLLWVLAWQGRASVRTLANRTGVTEDFTRAWLRRMHTAGYIEATANNRQYYLSAEQMIVLVQADSGTDYKGGLFDSVEKRMYDLGTKEDDPRGDRVYEDDPGGDV